MAPTLTIDHSLNDVLHEVVYTYKYLSKTGHLASHLAIFAGLVQQGKSLQTKADAFHEDIFEAEIDAEITDAKLNAICAEVLIHVNELKDDKERSLLRSRLIANKSPSVFYRPVLGPQLEAVRAWPSVLSELSFVPLKSLAPSVQTMVEEANTAEKNLDAKLLEEQNFFSVGDFKKYVDQVNAARKQLEGDAEAFRHSHPELNLPKDFAKMLFRQRERDVALSSAKLAKKIASAEGELSRLKKIQEGRLNEAKAEEDARKELERQAKLAQIAQKEKDAALLLEQAAALKAEVSS